MLLALLTTLPYWQVGYLLKLFIGHLYRLFFSELLLPYILCLQLYWVFFLFFLLLVRPLSI